MSIWLNLLYSVNKARMSATDRHLHCTFFLCFSAVLNEKEGDNIDMGQRYAIPYLTYLSSGGYCTEYSVMICQTSCRE